MLEQASSSLLHTEILNYNITSSDNIVQERKPQWNMSMIESSDLVVGVT